MIDSHCHLADKQFISDLDAVIARAKEAAVTAMVTIADSLGEGERCIGIAGKFPEVFCTVGVHPHHAKDWGVGSREKLLQIAKSSKKVRAIGEIGLDYHYDFSPREAQRDVFRTQLELAKELQLPAVIHCREAIADVRAIVDEVAPPTVVLHCCTERWEDVALLVERGSLLSFTGIATYPRSEEIRRTIKACPLEQMMIETDAPYLAPVPHRGKRNEPAYVVEVAKVIAKEKGISLEEVDAATTKNAVEFFRLPS